MDLFLSDVDWCSWVSTPSLGIPSMTEGALGAGDKKAPGAEGRSSV